MYIYIYTTLYIDFLFVHLLLLEHLEKGITIIYGLSENNMKCVNCVA